MQVFWKGHQYASAKDRIASLTGYEGPIIRPDDLDSGEDDDSDA
jgi:hypothetical protein